MSGVLQAAVIASRVRNVHIHLLMQYFGISNFLNLSILRELKFPKKEKPVPIKFGAVISLTADWLLAEKLTHISYDLDNNPLLFKTSSQVGSYDLLYIGLYGLIPQAEQYKYTMFGLYLSRPPMVLLSGCKIEWQYVNTLARRRLGLKSHSRSSPVTGGLVLGACLQATRAARESFRTSGIHEYSRCPADSANGGG